MKTSRLPGFAFVSIAVILLSSLSASGAAAQTPAPTDPIPPDPAVITGTLDNGLRYFVHENDQPENRAELRLVVNAGSILEDEDQLGLAHFVEHMAFNGTENFEKQALVDYLESIGMQFGPDINAYTSFDETVYMLQVPMDDPEMLATAFRILEDWAQGVVFDPEEVDKERGVVIEEWRGRRGAGARIQDQQFPVLFQGSLYAERLPIGKPEILETAPAERLRSFYEDWYRPDLMAIIAVGDFDGAEMEATIRERFAGLTGPAEPRPRIAVEVPIDHPPLVTIATDPEAPGSQVGVLYKQPPAPRGTIGDFRRGLVEGLYSGMLNARLNELRLQADPPFMFGFSGQGQFARGVDAYQLVAVVAEDGIERGLEALLTEAERVVQNGFTDSELEREKTNTRRGYERRLAERENQESGALASRYIQVFLQGRSYPDIETQMELVDAFLPGITLDETNGVAQAWLAEQGRVVAPQEFVRRGAPLRVLCRVDVVAPLQHPASGGEIEDVHGVHGGRPRALSGTPGWLLVLIEHHGDMRAVRRHLDAPDHLVVRKRVVVEQDGLARSVESDMPYRPALHLDEAVPRRKHPQRLVPAERDSVPVGPVAKHLSVDADATPIGSHPQRLVCVEARVPLIGAPALTRREVLDHHAHGRGEPSVVVDLYVADELVGEQRSHGRRRRRCVRGPGRADARPNGGEGERRVEMDRPEIPGVAS